MQGFSFTKTVKFAKKRALLKRKMCEFWHYMIATLFMLFL